jgi:amicoumacin kinase
MVVPESVVDFAVARFGLDKTRLRPLEREGAPDGAVYRCRLAGNEHFLKIKPMSGDRALEQDRLAFVADLRTAGIAVPELVSSDQGQLIEFAEHDQRLFSVSLSLKAPGRHILIPQDWNGSLITAFGTLMGQMHAFAAKYQGAPNLGCWRDEVSEFRRSCQDPEIGRLWEYCADAFTRLPQEQDCFGAIHNDMHLGNLLLNENKARPTDPDLIVLDFDVCTRHWFVMDIAIALIHPLLELRYRAPHEMKPFVERFLAAYTAQHPLSPEWRQRIPLFMRYRIALLVLAISREMGYPERLPQWLSDRRAWALSGEPIVDLSAE